MVSTTFGSVISTDARRPLFMNAFHWVAFVASVENDGVSAVGISDGMAVARRSNVARIAALSTGPSNANVCERNQTSKKSFIRLFAMARWTIARSFSATTISFG